MKKNLAALTAYKNKFTNKFFGYVHIPATTKKKGNVLFSYLSSPFTLLPHEKKTDPHSNYWECQEMVRLFNVRGYDVDCIAEHNTSFLPRKKYVAYIDAEGKLDYYSKFLNHDCKKVYHVLGMYHEALNKNEMCRLQYLTKRRNVHFKPSRSLTKRSIECVDYLEGFGNQTVHDTYKHLNKPIFPIPISVTQLYDFPTNKDYESRKKNFLFFSGGGAILKGLDLVVEAFAKLPQLNLFIIGPAVYEKDFAQEYEEELSLPNIKYYPRPKISSEGIILVQNIPFNEIVNSCVALVYPSSSEGTSGAVIQALHAGIIPIITPETGLDPNVGGITLKEASVESVMEAVLEVAKKPNEELSELTKQSWNFVRKHHTKETFSREYGRFIDEILHL
ncbi:MAG: Group 1 glycosyl transferase [Patescibacteria group bacterium]|jgi:glycosyltransferase involved in cell wall biosynthesis|nr:Group 1 glycosyl transferase [Patescibacteria group bacterium]